MWAHDPCQLRMGARQTKNAPLPDDDKNFFISICGLLTLFLICKELFTFVVEKPTSTSREEKDIEIKVIPEVVICLQPGFDIKVLEKIWL